MVESYPCCDYGKWDDRCTINFRIPPRGYYTVCDVHADEHVPALDFTKCEGSYGHHAGEITWGPDPFAEEVHEDYTPHWLCDSCRYESRMDV